MLKIKRLDGASASFSRKARERIPTPVIQRIRDLNWMDNQLHEVASDLASNMIQDETARGMQVLFLAHQNCSLAK